MKKEPNYPLYVVNEKKKAVTCKIKTKGQFFLGIARCCNEDVFDLQRGKDIAYYRCRLGISKYNLQQDIIVRDTISDIINRTVHFTHMCNKVWYDYLEDIKRRIENRKKTINTIEKKIEELM